MNIIDGYLAAFKLGSLDKAQCIIDTESELTIYIGNYNSIPVICIEGSHDTKNWITNFEFLFARWKEFGKEGVKVHGGYLDAWLRIRNQVFTLLPTKSQKIMVTGYSMGGGLAPIISLDLTYEGYTDIECYAFEGPRVFNNAGKKEFISLVKNAIGTKYNRDIVPVLPPWYKRIKPYIYPKDSSFRWWKLVSIKDHIDFQSIDPAILFKDYTNLI
jgi:Lipase (class 3)